MDAAAKAELLYIRSELKAIIAELEAISSGIRADFSGVGSEKCADSLDEALVRYRKVYNKLNNLDTAAPTCGFGCAGSSGGGSR